MTHDRAIEILINYQLWRRGESPYDFGQPVEMPFTPEELGQAIEIAIACLSKSEENEHQSDLSLKTEVQNHSEQALDMVTQFDERVAKLNEQYGYPFEPMPYRMMISYVASRNNVAEMLTLIAEMQAHIRKLEASLEIAEDTANHFKLAYENIIVNRIREEAGI